MAKKKASKKKAKAERSEDHSAAVSSETTKRKSGFPVVGIGASAGGLEALEELFDDMPADTGMAFVVVTHQHPGHTSLLPELLGKVTEMPVVEASDGMKLQPDHVYVGPSGGHLAIINGTLHRMETGTESAPRLPIDYFFRSLAEDQKERAICIVLSGTGTDGTLGLRAIKGESGMAMVQHAQSAKYVGMPSSAEGTGLADYVLPPTEMPKQLSAYASGPYLTAGILPSSEVAVLAEPMQKIFLLLRNRTGHDFSSYKVNTIRRRIERRMNVHQIRQPQDYVRYLRENAHEIDVLFKELLISVTCFFRDPEAWQSLAAGPLPELIKSQPTEYTFRAWIPGCATGEEVYSLAITLRETMDKMSRRFDVQIFGTDLDRHAVDVARMGVYPSGIGVDVSPTRLERFFTRDESAYRIRNEIREMAVFAPQNVIKDPPFTKLDVLFCRNLLIYLNADLQKRLLPVFHYALKPGGLLVLGPSETIGGFTDLFESVDKKWKIFRRKDISATMHILPMMSATMPEREEVVTTAISTRKDQTQISVLLERLALARFCPAFCVVNDRGDILYVHGRTGEYLELAEGQARTNVLDMARDGLSHELASAMRHALNEDGEVVRENVRVKTNGEYAQVNLAVLRIRDPEPIRGLLMITFRPGPPLIEAIPPLPASGDSTPQPGQVEILKRELQYLTESYQTTQEELETSNEELKSTNEELQSTNEEMQSTNEELETSKEEMHSLNEELTTVNAELQSKVEDLSQANDDMQNLLNSTDIATIFLDDDLNIKRYTKQATEIVTLRETDIGRPIGELASRLSYGDLVSDCTEVLNTLVFKKHEVTTIDGGWYSMRIMPYRTVDKVIDGLVLTFVNISDLKEAEKTGELRKFFEGIFDTVRQPLIVLDKDCNVLSANRYFYETFRVRPKLVEGTSLWEIADGEWDISELRELLEEILKKNTAFDNYQVDHEFPKLGRRVFLLNARKLEYASAMTSRILLAIEDVTERYV